MGSHAYMVESNRLDCPWKMGQNFKTQDMLKRDHALIRFNHPAPQRWNESSVKWLQCTHSQLLRNEITSIYKKINNNYLLTFSFLPSQKNGSNQYF
mmetsp:Transcript_2895/g.4419  ORF Transcript_2895/g.4419 Transcript_2895/m.4419 type:complete len:96 (+) Transcript_2895:250-537(+)